MTGRGQWIDGRWVPGRGPELHSVDPATGRTVWSGREAAPEEVARAVEAARRAARDWAGRPVAARRAVLETYREQVRAHREALAEAVCRETGKPRWEARGEADAAVGKVELALEAYGERCAPRRVALGDAEGGIHYRPLGVVAVLGPFNLPVHLPNGQIVPALLAGNAVVFKPSELTPGVGELLAQLWERAGLPPGVLHLVQGGAPVGRALVEHAEVDGVLFTGSYRTGQAIHRALGGRPEVLLALEMGGNNPLVVWDVADTAAAALHVVLSAFVTAGQRCTCARRLIVPESGGEAILDAVASAVRGLRVGPATDRPEPFLGPVVSEAAAAGLLEAQERLLRAGGVARVPMESRGGAFVTPGIVDVTGVSERPDEEWFGPLLQAVRVGSFDAALDEANRTAYGLAAGLLADEPALWERFRREVRAGVLTWNRPTTGASGRLPFGGLGRSGNHRPAGFFTVDACADPVASVAVERLAAPAALPPGIEAGRPEGRR
ncbi:MAG: succinylglutamate-semialdehyde dehydrogenase [Deferrisomatales bacterium]